jgi:hypothetical protein
MLNPPKKGGFCTFSLTGRSIFSQGFIAYFLGQCQKVGGVWGKAPKNNEPQSFEEQLKG